MYLFNIIWLPINSVNIMIYVGFFKISMHQQSREYHIVQIHMHEKVHGNIFKTRINLAKTECAKRIVLVSVIALIYKTGYRNEINPDNIKYILCKNINRTLSTAQVMFVIMLKTNKYFLSLLLQV